MLFPSILSGSVGPSGSVLDTAQTQPDVPAVALEKQPQGAPCSEPMDGAHGCCAVIPTWPGCECMESIV